MSDTIPVVAPIDLERIALGDPRATRDAIKALRDTLNAEILRNAQLQAKLAARVTALEP